MNPFADRPAAGPWSFAPTARSAAETLPVSGDAYGRTPPQPSGRVTPSAFADASGAANLNAKAPRPGFTVTLAATALRPNGDSVRVSVAAGSPVLTVAATAPASAPVSQTGWSGSAAVSFVAWAGGRLLIPVPFSFSPVVTFDAAAVAPGSPPIAGPAIVVEGGPEAPPPLAPGGADFVAPRPRGAGPITPFLSFELGALDASVSRLLGGREPGTAADPRRGEVGSLWSSVLLVGAGLAIETSRRWRHRLASRRVAADGKSWGPSLRGLS